VCVASGHKTYTYANGKQEMPRVHSSYMITVMHVGQQMHHLVIITNKTTIIHQELIIKLRISKMKSY